MRFRIKGAGPIPVLGAGASPAAIEKIATKWSYDLRNRRYWAGRDDSKAKRAGLAYETLTGQSQLGLDAPAVQAIADAGDVEVEFAPGPAAELAYAIPWEYLISAGTRGLRNGGMMVTRRLAAAPGRKARPPASFLFIESAPSGLGGLFTFDSERDLAVKSLDMPSHWTHSRNESASAIKAKIVKGQDIVHFAGFDAVQAAKLLGKEAKIDPSKGGIVVGGTGAEPVIITGREFEAAFAGMKRAPLLVLFNCYNSADSLAAMCLRGGAAAAIGFHDYVDDGVAEYFVGAFYREWRASGWRIHHAFAAAWQALSSNNWNLHGTGIVLWTADSRFDGEGLPGRDLRKLPRVPLEEQMVIKIEPRGTVNYSLLHNNQPLFLSFAINRVAGTAPVDLSILVELNVGRESYPFRANLRLGANSLHLHDKIKIPLTSEFARSLRDRVVSTIYTRIDAGAQCLVSQTDRVMILPIDEWSDDSETATRDPADRRAVWLPSFILPRDPAVRRIIDDAQKYLVALIDDPAAGFDGYQSIDEADPDTWWTVDSQAQAIWYAIVNDARLSYINPPPGGTRTTQRLRTPSDIVDGRRGTCIDLALLYAACLEYAEIYPAIILLTGHAFPAYWRSGGAHDAFVSRFVENVSAESADPRAGATMNSAGNSGTMSWAFDNDPQRLKEILRRVQRGELVPLETVSLTGFESFEEARRKGRENLARPAEFEYLLDVMQARSNEPPVMPLPLTKFGS